MGVPAFYKWLVKKYDRVVARARQDETEKEETEDANLFDNLYLDLNGVIHPCFHPDDDEFDDIYSTPTTFEGVFQNVFDYIDRLFNIVRPRKLLYMAIDGVAPRAKMNQQRSRRFRTAKDTETRECEEERLRRKFEKEGKQVLPRPESEVSDSNVITPGTEFMHKLSKALQRHITEKITHDPSWRNTVVILSDASVSGEGEHKIMSFIRRQRSLQDYDPNTRHCLYGLDADLIMLALSTHEPHFSILRECVFTAQETQPKSAAKPFEFVDIGLLREYLENDLKIQDPPKDMNMEFERIVDDFVFMCFFAGNDFLPHLPSLEIHQDALDLLMTVYKKEFNKIGGYLVDMSKVEDGKAAFVKLSRVEKFILLVGAYEEKIFAKRSEIRGKTLRRFMRECEQSEEENAISEPYNEVSSASVSTDSEEQQILQNSKELKEQINDCIRRRSDFFRSGIFPTDKVKLGTHGWKERYYKVKFSAESIESKRKEIVNKYTEGLLWVLKYYYSCVPSWSWFYPYQYAPFASDFRGMSQVRLNFQKDVPLKPFDQLLAVLPPRSAHALPESYSQLMVDEKSSIIDFYPLDFELDVDGTRFAWQGVVKLPFIEEARLLTESRKLEKKLTEEEAVRNSVGSDLLFVAKANKVGAKIRSSCHNNVANNIEMSTSDGIGGILRLCNENVKVDLCCQEDYVICAHYELPVGGERVPGLLQGLNLPEKRICEDDIMETTLWHERSQYEGKFRNGNNYNNTWRSNEDSKYGNGNSESNRWRSNEGSRRGFESSSSGSVVHKGGGVGWSSGPGRGKPAAAPADPNRNVEMDLDRKMTSLRISSSHSEKSRGDATKPFVWGRGRGV